jgi:hypothetical protein
MKKLLLTLFAAATVFGTAYAGQTKEDILARLDEIASELIALDEKEQLTAEDDEIRNALLDEVERLQDEVEALESEQD